MNLLYFFRFFWLLLISLYTYIKIINIEHISKMKLLSAIVFCAFVGTILSFIPPLYEVVFLGSVFIFLYFTTRVHLKRMITALIVSVGISLGSEMIVLFLLSYGLFYFAPEQFTIPHAITEFPWYPWRQLAVSIVSFLLVHFFFRLKRLQKGFAFLNTNEGNWIGIYFGLLIGLWRSLPPFLYAFVHKYNLGGTDASFVQLFIFFIIFICLIGIHLWWRSHTTFLYHKRLAAHRDTENLEEIKKLQLQIKNLSESNDFLSKAVHRDNKLIPAMYNAVADLLSVAQPPIVESKGTNILQELDELMSERNEMIVKIEKEFKSLPSTEMDRVDYLLEYMRHRALADHIQFDFLMPVKIKAAVEAVISKQNLETLLADLIENALIATRYSRYKKIRVIMGIVDQYFEITVQDSGIPFEIETLVRLGLKKASTHLDHGGSGIGYLSIFSILHTCQASLILSEMTPKHYSFSKSIQIRFDGIGQFVIHSNRAEEIRLSTQRKDLLTYLF